jgi:VanZ family protein
MTAGSPSGGGESPEPHDHTGGSRPPLGAALSPHLLLHALVLAALFALWTWKLLEPVPIPAEVRAELDEVGLTLVAQKTLHACVYAVLAVLVGTLPVPRRWRHVLIGLLVVHGLATEIGQTFVPHRTGRAYDVVIDWIGIAVGLLMIRFAARLKRTRTGNHSPG